jgi:hypothetical protein
MTLLNLPNEILTEIVRHVNHPTDCATWSVLSRECRKMMEQVVISQIQSILIYFIPLVRAPDQQGKTTSVVHQGLRIRISTPTTTAEPLPFQTNCLFTSEEFRHTQGVLNDSLPYLWEKSPSNIQIFIISETEDIGERLHSFGLQHANQDTMQQLTTQLQRLQTFQPKQISGFHILSTLPLPIEVSQMFLDTWQSTLTQVSLCTENIPPAAWIPLLKLCPLTHLTIALGPNSVDEAWNFACLQTLTQKPGSKLTNIEFVHLRKGASYPLNTTTNIIGLTKLLESMPLASLYRIVTPPPAKIASHGGFRRDILLEVVTKMTTKPEFSPMQQSLQILDIPSYDFSHTLSWKYFIAFPHLKEIRGLLFSRKLTGQIVAICQKAIRKERNIRLHIQCAPQQMGMYTYVQIVTHLLHLSHLSLWTQNMVVSMTTPDHKENRTFHCTFQTFDDLIRITVTAPLEMIDSPRTTSK